MSGFEQYKCDVLCLGGSGAAVTAAVKAANCGADVIMVSKEPVGYGDTRISMGMLVNPGIVEGDDLQAFYRDLLSCGENINNPRLARIMAEKAVRAREILEKFGHLYQRDKDGLISPDVVFSSGGHTKPRTLRCPPNNGVGIGNALRAASAKSGFKVFEETIAYKLLTVGNKAAGAVCFDLVHGKVLVIIAKTVIIATGGAGWLYYPHTDCMAGATGDGYALAYEAGAELTDMEMVQYAPFGLTHPHSMCGIFIGDPAIAGPAGVLKDRNGNIILDNLSCRTRAEVTRSMSKHLFQGATEYGGLLLDMSANLKTDKGKKLWEQRYKLGQLDAIRFSYGEKAFRWEEPLDVAPTSHYNMGGIRVNTQTRSTVSGLYAVGQAMGGVFGADRLGSVSLAEIFVFGEIAGEAAAYEAKQTKMPIVPEVDAVVDELNSFKKLTGRIQPLMLKRRLQKVMWEKVGIARDENGLKEALTEIESIANDIEEIGVSPIKSYNKEILHAIELKHMLLTAEMITRSALMRQETRGSHLRLDFPERNDNKWRCNIIGNQCDGRMQIRTEAVDSL